MSETKGCTHPGCPKPHHAHGFCDTHYRQSRIYSPYTPSINPSTVTGAPVADRFSKQIDLEADIFRFVRNQRGTPVTYELLSNAFDISMQKARDAVASLSSRGMNVHIDEVSGVVAVPEGMIVNRDPESRIDVSKFHGQLLTYGVTADNHLCSKYARMDVLNALFDIWAEQGVTTVLQGGNMIDGEARFNKFDLVTRPGIDAQADYLVNEWPYREGITTEFVTGDDHEGWYVQREGININTYLQNAADAAGRADMKFMSYMEHTYNLQAAGGAGRMCVQHAGGGSAYALSYTVQKIVESYQGGEKPTILIVGHFHKAEYSYPREVHCLQAGCTQDQSPFMRKKRIQAMVGGWTLSFVVDNNGIVHGFTPQWHPFYDRDFYHRWSYYFKPKTTSKASQ